jgi:hypothetical protein
MPTCARCVPPATWQALSLETAPDPCCWGSMHCSSNTPPTFFKVQPAYIGCQPAPTAIHFLIPAAAGAHNHCQYMNMSAARPTRPRQPKRCCSTPTTQQLHSSLQRLSCQQQPSLRSL